ncbi:MAG: hypothetical protein LBV59_01500 [Sphingobacterium sp.]|uniref:PKD-like family lipoprotein n=1 Tax=Sphingobacterium sp. TaxID=341027 RepID=UPI00284D84FF|nr:PKD-like family lipoprotein [Sphingobacterium sp.]MDR3006574.1 hypothetical protein [Sphingobacterium sp.]
MKNTIYYFACFTSFMLILSACKKDLGNYNYSTLNKVVITEMTPQYIGYTGKKLTISPKLNMSNGQAFQTEGYNFEWFSVDSNMLDNSKSKTVLGHDAKLDIVLPLVPSRYALYYRVTDKETGYFSEFKASLQVTSEIADGWLVLNEINNTARLDMLAYNQSSKKYIPYTDIISTMSNLKVVGRPLLVQYTDTRDISNFQSIARIYIGTDQHTYSFNNQKYTWDIFQDLKNEVMRPTGNDFHALKFSSTIGQTYLLDSDGILNYENITTMTMWGPTLNRLNTGGTIKISPYIADTKSAWWENYIVVFDIQNQRFLIHRGSNQALIIPSSSQPDIFKPEAIGKDLLYLDFAPIATEQFYALVKNPTTGKINLLRFTANDTEFVLLGDDQLDSSIPIDKADQYAIDPNYGYLLYSIGNKLYQYDPFNKVNKVILDLGNRTISRLKYQKSAGWWQQRYDDLFENLILCSYDPSQPNTSGKMELYNIPLNGTPKLTSSYVGFGKIVDVSYRE